MSDGSDRLMKNLIDLIQIAEVIGHSSSSYVAISRYIQSMFFLNIESVHERFTHLEVHL